MNFASLIREQCDAFAELTNRSICLSIVDYAEKNGGATPANVACWVEFGDAAPRFWSYALPEGWAPVRFLEHLDRMGTVRPSGTWQWLEIRPGHLELARETLARQPTRTEAVDVDGQEIK